MSTEEIKESLARLLQYQKEAIAVFNSLNLQEIGKAIEAPLGSSISAHVLPWVLSKKAETEELDKFLKVLVNTCILARETPHSISPQWILKLAEPLIVAIGKREKR